MLAFGAGPSWARPLSSALLRRQRVPRPPALQSISFDRQSISFDPHPAPRLNGASSLALYSISP
jgi:hypothetical protein